jgi:methionyl-tRNA formyltransferase
VTSSTVHRQVEKNGKLTGVCKMTNKTSILFLGKENDEHCSKALSFVQGHCSDVTAYLGTWGDPLPEGIERWKGDYIVSYLSRWVVPESLLLEAKIAAINFHPGSPDYPGIGCNNFALYEGADEYGVTCHHMGAKVDVGKIIAVKRFPVFPNDDVGSLLSRTYDFQLVLFYEIVAKILKNESLPSANETWSRKPFSRKEFNKLFHIDPAMLREEIERRVRAVSYGKFQPAIEIAGHVFEFKFKKDG